MKLMVLKVELNERDSGATIRISSAGQVMAEEMPSFPKMLEELSSFYARNSNKSQFGIGFFHAQVSVNARGGWHVVFDFSRAAAWQPW